jgi:putative component of membrane protein insertase Oxa1/YidC/SpoIIIJ protein YidD
VTYLFHGKRNVLVKYNPVSLFFGGLLFAYQKAISPQIAVSCPYEINCSNFSKRCIQKYGLLKGIALTADRLTRCTQYTLIDLKNVQLNKQKKIIDPVEQYTLRHHDHK